MPRSSVAPLAPPVNALLRRYADAGEPLSCVPVAQGLLNRGYRLATSRGSYFLKQHLDARTADRATIVRQHRATERLGALGVPVAPPLPDSEGRTVAMVDGHCYALHPWVEGSHRGGAQLTATGSRRLGALLGLVHTALEQVMAATEGPADAPGDGERPTTGGEAAGGESAGRTVTGCTDADREAADRPAMDRTDADRADADRTAAHREAASRDAADPEQSLRLIDELLALARGRRRRDAFDELAEYRLLERRRLLAEHAHRRPPPACAGGWVHGDFHPLNLLYRGAEPAAIIDWDRLGVQPRAEEAVRAAAIFFVRPGGTLDLPKVRAYARAYRRSAGAEPAELAAAVHRVWWERLNDFWILRWHYQRDDARADPQFPAASALAVWWTGEYEAVRDAFTS
ncbi:phosphotransferase [Streptomyces lichenis]|uniref:Phosphotransferase n=1 Tax=Streptomyces lichenis TaxID=2306967 RepID=A0ABT0I4G5_9ACTN|nr:phosphotransferase [Streptomyces lichenis]MCK8676210.1 phosphotransferase [Streptomyces lichenis]